jgi:hypothetical protein
VADFKVTPQDTITFLQDYIESINLEIDELIDGQNMRRQMKSLQLRIELLERDKEKRFIERIKFLKKELEKLTEEFNVLNPQVEVLEAERAYYRQLLNDISR